MNMKNYEFKVRNLTIDNRDSRARCDLDIIPTDFFRVKPSDVFELQRFIEGKLNDLQPTAYDNFYKYDPEFVKGCYKQMANTLYGASSFGRYSTPQIVNVIFNDPATIVFWSDDTKTIVKAQDGEEYDREKGLALAISKKMLGNQGNYYNVFDKWLNPKDDK